MSKINNRNWQNIQRAKENDHISLKSDSRVFCFQSYRTKFLYENERKAQVALRFNEDNGAKRYYICSSCLGYHLTSKSRVEYLAKRKTMGT